VAAYAPRRANRPRDHLRAAIFLLALLSIGTFYGYRNATAFARFQADYVPLALQNDPVVAIHRARNGTECETKSGTKLWLLFFRDARYGHGSLLDNKLYVGDQLTKKPYTLELLINNEVALDGKSYIAARPINTGGGGWGIISLISGLLATGLLVLYLIYFEVRPRMARARERG